VSRRNRHDPKPWAWDLEEEDIRRERSRARELRATQWWKRRCSTGICRYCGRSVAPAELTMDHLVPLARGGRTVKSNVVPCCKECNNRKRQMLPAEWERWKKSRRREDSDGA
jgi:5-methylcytosine-specific restriction endonuclease McrA